MLSRCAESVSVFANVLSDLGGSLHKLEGVVSQVSQIQVPELLEMVKRTTVVIDVLQASFATFKAEGVVAAKDAEMLAKAVHDNLAQQLSKLEKLEAKVTDLQEQQQSSAAEIARIKAQDAAMRIAAEQKAALDQAKAERLRQADIKEAERKRELLRQRLEDDMAEQKIARDRDAALAKAHAQAINARVDETEAQLKAHTGQLATQSKAQQHTNETVEALGDKVKGLERQLEERRLEEEKQEKQRRARAERKRRAEEAARRKSGARKELTRNLQSSKIAAAAKGRVVRRQYQLCRDSAAREATPVVMLQKAEWRAAKDLTKRERAKLVALADIDARFITSKAQAPVATPLQARAANAMQMR